MDIGTYSDTKKVDYPDIVQSQQYGTSTRKNRLGYPTEVF